MRFELTGRHVTITPALRSTVEHRLTRLERRLGDSIVSVQVVLTREHTRHRVEATLHARGDHFLHGEAIGHSVKTAVDAAFGKIEHQAQKLKGRWSPRQRAGASPGKAARRQDGRRSRATVPAPAVADGERRTRRILRATRYAVKPMTIDDAALEVTGGDSAFVVFRNANTDAINVLFRRPDGHLGLIEPEE